MNDGSCPTTLNVDQRFETGINDHLRDETRLPALACTAAEMLTESKKEDRSNRNRPPDIKANPVALDTNTNNIADKNMLDLSDDEDELEFEMSDFERKLYKMYYHDEMYVEYNCHPTPKKVYVHNPDLVPITLLVYDTIKNKPVERPLVILLIDGSSGSLINQRAIPRGAVPSKSPKSHITTTASGSFDTSLTVGLKNIQLPEFSNGRKIEGWNCRIFNSSECQYDIIIGLDLMRHIGIDNFFSTDTIQWIDRSVKMKHPHHYDLMITNLNRIYEDYEDKEALCEACAELFEAKEILNQAYKKVSPNECANDQHHMSKDERLKFQAILEKHKVLFDGELGLYPHKKSHLQLKKGAIPVHKKPYPVLYKRRDVFREILKNLVRDGVLKPCGVTNWASPTFVIPKPQSNTVRWVSGCGFFSIAMRSLIALASQSSDDVCGICTCSGKNSIMSVVLSPLVAEIYTL